MNEHLKIPKHTAPREHASTQEIQNLFLMGTSLMMMMIDGDGNLYCSMKKESARSHGRVNTKAKVFLKQKKSVNICWSWAQANEYSIYSCRPQRLFFHRLLKNL